MCLAVANHLCRTETNGLVDGWDEQFSNSSELGRRRRNIPNTPSTAVFFTIFHRLGLVRMRSLGGVELAEKVRWASGGRDACFWQLEELPD